MGNCDYLCQTGIFNALAFGLSASLFVAYAIRRNTGKRSVALFLAGVSIFGCGLYALNVLGVVPTPIPATLGRNFVAAVALAFCLVGVVIWKW